jgi:hypothetical protein
MDLTAQPVLVIAGRYDRAAGLEPQRAPARALANARFEEFERSAVTSPKLLRSSNERVRGKRPKKCVSWRRA